MTTWLLLDCSSYDIFSATQDCTHFQWKLRLKFRIKETSFVSNNRVFVSKNEIIILKISSFVSKDNVFISFQRSEIY